MTKQARYFSFTLAIGMVGLCAGATAHADTVGKKPRENAGLSSYGFYHDAKSNQYFSNRNSTFSVRPLEKDQYLERIEISVDEGEFQAYQGKISFEKEGSHNIRFRAVDPVLNWSPIQSFRVHVDMTPPKSTINWSGASYQAGTALFVSPEARLIVSAQDNLAGVSKIMWRESADSANARPFSGSEQFKKEMLHRAEFSALDNVGNTEAWQRVEFHVDGTAPVTTSAVNGSGHKKGSDLYLGNGAQIVLSAADQGAGVQAVEYQIDNGPVTTYSQPIPAAGNRMEIRYRALDQVGNKEPWKTLTAYVDSTPPTIALQEHGKFVSVSGKIYARPGFVLSSVVSDSQSGIQETLVSRDGKTFEKSTLREFKFDAPGEYVFKLQARDNVQNLAEGNPYVIVIDDTAPVSSFKTTENVVLRDGVYLSAVPNIIQFSGNDGGVGVERIEVSYDGKTFTTMEKGIDLTTWGQSRRTVYYRAVDRLGNHEKAQSMEVMVLRNGPKVDLFVESETLPDVPLSRLLQEPAPRRPASGERSKNKPE